MPIPPPPVSPSIDDAPSGSPHKGTLAQSARKRTRWNVWVTIALFLSVTAVGVEGIGHLCASTLFDPLPDLVTGIAYAGVIFFLWFNEAVLTNVLPDKVPGTEGLLYRPNHLIRFLGPKRAVGIALAGTPVSLLIAGMATWMFIPVMAFFPILILTVVGILAFTPILDLILLVIQWRALRAVWRAETGAAWDKRVAVATGLALIAAVFFLILRPALIGNGLADAMTATGERQERAFNRLRALGGQQALLDLTYHKNPPYWVCFGYQAARLGPWPASGYNGEGLGGDLEAARRAYFLLTGDPFESVPRPASSFRQDGGNATDDVAVEETGGLVVGRPVPGLSLKDSRMEFTADGQTETADGTWTLTFHNATNAPQEARADILLTPGATCHAVSLWINGTERPAAFGSPQKVRHAYQEVAVVQRRDPLLVTMPAPGHLLAQCFPVPSRGDMKIKIGITTPLTWRGASTRPNEVANLRLTLPAFGSVNFEVPDRLPNDVLFGENGYGGDGSLSLRGKDFFAPVTFLGVHNAQHNRTMPRVGDRLATGVVRTQDPLAYPTRPVDVWLLVDASRGMNELSPSNLQTAVDQLPAGSRVFFGDTKAAALREVTNGSPTSTFAFARFVGGTDPAPALENALRQARETSQADGHASAVVFLHAASPGHVSHWDGVRSELHRSLQSAEKTGRSGPALVGVQLAPRAPDAVAMDLAGFTNVYACRALSGDSSGVSNAVRFAAQTVCLPENRFMVAINGPLHPLGGHTPGINGVILTGDGGAGLPEGSPLARLARAGLTTEAWFKANAAEGSASLDLRVAGGRPAAIARLVTPLSSAVVLDTEEAYKKNGLDTKDGKKGYDNALKTLPPANVNIPEPATGVLLAGGLCAGWAGLPLLRRRKRRAFDTAL